MRFPKLFGKPRRTGIPPLRGLLPLLIVLVIWELVGNTKSAYFEPPRLWFNALKLLSLNDKLLNASVETLTTWLEGLALATLLGILVGVIIGRSHFWDRTFGPFLEFCRVLPAAAIVPLAALIAGYTIRMQLAVVVFSAVWPVLLAVRSSAQSISRQLLDLGKSMRLGRFGALRKLVLPSVVPGVLTGIRISAPMTLVIVLLVEILTQVGGVGALMITAEDNFASAQLYGLICITGAIGLIASWGVSYLSRRAERYWSRK